MVADRACRALGMVPAEEHPAWAQWSESNAVPSHKFWRMSPDGTRLVSWGGDVFSFSVQLGRAAFNVDSPAEYEELTDSYKKARQ